MITRYMMALAAGILALPASTYAQQKTPVCTPAPKTGCSQSEEVRLKVQRQPENLHWRWQGATDSRAIAEAYALCLYDEESTRQTETAAPAPGTKSLVLEIDIDRPVRTRTGLTASAGTGGWYGWLMNLIGRGENLGLEALDHVKPEAVISQLQTSTGQCFGKSVSVRFKNGPLFPESGKGIIDEIKGRTYLNKIASEYNASYGGEPLNMTLWITSVAATQIQNKILTSSPDDHDLEALFGALHISGWYGGIWFVRDGFQRPAPEAADPRPAEAAIALYREAKQIALDADDETVFAFLVDEKPALNAFAVAPGTGLRSLVSSYGYNTGYSLNVNEETVGGKVTPPPPDKLVCAGMHPRLTAPNTPNADAPLFGCEYNPSFLSGLDDLRRYRDAYVAKFPEKAAELKVFQDQEEARGRTIWNYRLGDVIKTDQEVRQALWDVDNAFLEVVHGAGLMNMAAQVEGVADMGRVAALASSGVLKGWLQSYNFGLSAPEPRLLPKWDLGTTPVERVE